MMLTHASQTNLNRTDASRTTMNRANMSELKSMEHGEIARVAPASGSDARFAEAQGPRPEYIGRVDSPVRIRAIDLNVAYGEKTAIQHISLEIAEREITALMGPSGCGKSTFIRALNRMHDL